MLRSKSAHTETKRKIEHAEPKSILLEKETQTNKQESADEVFDYKSSNEKEKEKEDKLEKVKEMRFAEKAKALPAVGNPQGVYQFGSPYGRGYQDFNSPMRGSYAALGGGYGPMASVPHPFQGMGSHSPMIDPRGFGLTGQNNNVTDLFSAHSMFPSALSPMLTPNPSANNGYGYAYPFPAVMKGFGPENMPFPPFSGKPFRALGPHGPFTMDTNITLPGMATPGGKNTTLMGPLPFGPYGGSQPVTPSAAFGPYAYGGLPQMVNRGQIPATVPGNPFGARGGGGYVPGVPYHGPQAPFGMPSPYPHLNLGIPATGFGQGGFAPGPLGGFAGQFGNHFQFNGPFPGVQSTFNPSVVMHHQATMRQEKLGQFPLPGMNNIGLGFPHPDSDRYHSVLSMPPVAIGGAEAAKRF